MRTPLTENGMTLPQFGDVDLRVPKEDCLPMPSCYRLPKSGVLADDVHDCLAALHGGANVYIHGLPGSGKDALIHAYSSVKRIPAKVFQIMPNMDIQPWLFSRAFNKEGTFYEEGALLKALRDGYTSPRTGEKIPYLILISDFDRATPDQAEILRMILDSIEGRIQGAEGKMHSVLKGSQVIATGNSAGSGDMRSRCVSSQLMDASIMDRFDAVFEFRWMEWSDESLIIKEKFPNLVEKFPSCFDLIGKAVQKIRERIHKGEIFFELSHRGVCRWFRQVESLARMGYDKTDILRRSFRVLSDAAPNSEVSLALTRLVDAELPR